MQFYDYPYDTYEDSIIAMVQNGTLAESVVDARVEDIIRVKMYISVSLYSSLTQFSLSFFLFSLAERSVSLSLLCIFLFSLTQHSLSLSLLCALFPQSISLPLLLRRLVTQPLSF